MKKLYWRSRAVSRTKVILIALGALGGLMIVETGRINKMQPNLKEKIAAAQLARQAMERVRTERLRRQLPIDPEVDPAQSGLVGLLISPITTNTAALSAKRTSINPNFAAVIVSLLKKAGLKEGDLVAVGCSGSFPALNIAAIAAIETLKLKPIVISSVASSQWGANDPAFAWLDMERLLQESGLFSSRSIAASRGGIEDVALGLSKQGKQLLDEAIARNEVRALRPKSYPDSVDERMKIYREQAGGGPIMAYINIGGGAASVGSRVGRRLFKSGLNRTAPKGALAFDSMMVRFVNQGVPVINLLRVEELAQTYGFPIQPDFVPPVGEGQVFYRLQYNSVLALVVLLGVLAFIALGLRPGLSIPLGGASSASGAPPPPESAL